MPAAQREGEETKQLREDGVAEGRGKQNPLTWRLSLFFSIQIAWATCWTPLHSQVSKPWFWEGKQPAQGYDTWGVALRPSRATVEGRGYQANLVSVRLARGRMPGTYFLDLAHSFFQFFTKTGTTCSDVSSLFRDQRSVLSRGWR